MAAFRGPEILDWGVKVVCGQTPAEKRKAARLIVGSLIEQYCPNVLVIKRLHHSRSSRHLDEIVRQIEDSCSRHRIKIRRYSIQELEAALCPKAKITKRTLAGILANAYPALLYDFQRESQNRNPYRVRMFEAVALATVCWQQIEKK